MKKSSWQLVLLLTMAFWALSVTLMKPIKGTIDPMMIAFFRFLFAALALFPFMRFSGKLKLPKRKDFLPFIGLAILTVLPTPLLALGVFLSGTMNSAILLNTNPLWVAILAPLLIHEKMSMKKIIALMLGVFGVTLTVLNGKDISLLFQSDYFLGSAILILGAIIVALFTVFAKGLVKKYGGMYVTYFTIAMGFILLIPTTLLQGTFFDIPFIPFSTIIYLFFLGVFATALPYVLFANSMKHLPVSQAASFKLLIPVFAAIYAVSFLGESLTGFLLAGMIITGAGVYFVQKG